jgi:hypothetical protein
MLECRRLIHHGYPLFTHPLMGDIHLLKNPYRTVILGEKRIEVDVSSLSLIEEIIARIRFFPRTQRPVNNLEDYQFIDVELFQTAMDGRADDFMLRSHLD